ncbi:MAG: hypothetical protein U0175_28885 [Caldilineaceae bacterium]
MQAWQEAIDFLQVQGYAAYARNGALGESIVLPFGKMQIVGEIKLFPQVLWLYEIEQGWAICYPPYLTEDLKFQTLDHAVEVAQQFVKQYEQSVEIVK